MDNTQITSSLPTQTLIKQLASCNKSTRDKALKLLKLYLQSQQQVSHEELKKIWKGLFFCVWHADKAPVQSDLINSLSCLLYKLPLLLSVEYFSVFLITMRREWTGIDGHRLDKFYLLIRRFVNACFGSLALSMGFAEKFFELGSSVDCVQVNRKVLFGLHEEFLKLEKDFKVSGVDISVPALGVEDDEEIPNLIPITSVENGVKMSCEMENGASISKASKKKKKAKKELDGRSKKKKKIVVSSENEDEARVIANSFDSVNETANDGININGSVASELIPTSVEMENGTSASKSSKKKKKVKKDSEKKKNVVSVDDDMVIANGFDSVIEPANNENLIDFNESVVSNLRMQFEKVASEVGLDKDGSSSLDSPEVHIAPISKKRKRARSVDGKKKKKPDFTSVEGKDVGAETSEKSAKKVRFSVKNNIVWKPNSPMPPQDLRLPPSATPRGSALKKGLSPGPIREMPPATKKPMLKKKGLRGNKHVAPAVRRLRKLQGLVA